MRSYEEENALKSLAYLRQHLLDIDVANLEEALARDDQPNNTRDPDPIHRAVADVCRSLDRAVDNWQRACNVLRYIADTTPAKGRVSSLTDCIACDKPALSRVKSGLCEACVVECKAYLAANRKQSRSDFVAMTRDKVSQLSKNARLVGDG